MTSRVRQQKRQRVLFRKRFVIRYYQRLRPDFTDAASQLQVILLRVAPRRENDYGHFRIYLRQRPVVKIGGGIPFHFYVARFLRFQGGFQRDRIRKSARNNKALFHIPVSERQSVDSGCARRKRFRGGARKSGKIPQKRFVTVPISAKKQKQPHLCRKRFCRGNRKFLSRTAV